MNTFRRDNRTAFTFRHGGSMEVGEHDGSVNIATISGGTMQGVTVLTLDADELEQLAARLLAIAARLEYEAEVNGGAA